MNSAKLYLRSLLILLAVSFMAAGNGHAQQTVNTHQQKSSTTMNYLLFLPQGYDQNVSQKWPLVLFLHGAGESGTDIEKVKIHGLPKIVQTKTDFPAIVVSPQCPSAQEGWNRFLLKDLLDNLLKDLRVDASRVYVTGLSMGGRGTWEMLAYYPEMFAAAVPICGWGDTRLIRRASKVPIWVFHGAKDRVVPLYHSVELVEILQRENADVKITVYPDAGHDSWTETYNNPELYEWLFSKTK